MREHLVLRCGLLKQFRPPGPCQLLGLHLYLLFYICILFSSRALPASGFSVFTAGQWGREGFLCGGGESVSCVASVQVSQKRPITVSKETYYSVKRDLLQRVSCVASRRNTTSCVAS